MKNTAYNLFLAIVVSVCLHSCDLDTLPTDKVPEDVAFASVENAEQVLNGTWAYLMDETTIQGNPGWATIFLTSDAMGNDIAVNPLIYHYIQHYNFNFMNQPNSSTVLFLWTRAYKCIDSYNSIIAKIDDLPSYTDNTGDLRKRVKAQALVMRGYLYLNLATFYSFSYQKDPEALCVPIYTESTTDQTAAKPRSPLKDVYNRSITDLKDGYALFSSMGIPYERNEKYKVNKQVAAGILARAYLQMGDGYWNLAEKYAGEAQVGSQWMSKTTYTEGFDDISNVEWLWGHRQTTDQYVASIIFDFLDVVKGAYHSFLADPYFKDFFIKEITPANDTIYDIGDIRYSLFEWEQNEEQSKRLPGSLLYKKFSFEPNNASLYPCADIVIMRKAEMVLIEAESLAEQNQLGPAIAKLNDLRAARGASTPDLSSLTKDELVEEILIERRKELFGEGFSLSDILRRQKAVERKAVPIGTMVTVNGVQYQVQGHTVTRLPNGEPFTPNSPYYLFAVPLEETANNPNW